MGAMCLALTSPLWSIGSPRTLKTLPRTSSPTGTSIGFPVSKASIPLFSPLVDDNATHLTSSSPMCCATSATIFLPLYSIKIAFKSAGNSSCPNLISNTGPII